MHIQLQLPLSKVGPVMISWLIRSGEAHSINGFKRVTRTISVVAPVSGMYECMNHPRYHSIGIAKVVGVGSLVGTGYLVIALQIA